MKTIGKIFLLILFIIFGCKPKNESILNQQDFKLISEFYPAFGLPPCRIIIDNWGNKKTLSIDIIYKSNRHPDDTTFLKSIQNKALIAYDRKSNKDDTITDRIIESHENDIVFIDRLEEVSIKEKYFKQFTEKLTPIDLTKMRDLEWRGSIDGIVIDFKFSTRSIDNQFYFVTPTERDTVEMQLIKSIFYLLDKSIKDSNTIIYSAWLKTMYFSLPVDKNIPFKYFDINHKKNVP